MGCEENNMHVLINPADQPDTGSPTGLLPGCMLPDGAAPCDEYRELMLELDRTRVRLAIAISGMKENREHEEIFKDILAVGGEL